MTQWYCDCGELLDDEKARTHKCRRDILMQQPVHKWPNPDKIPDVGKGTSSCTDEDNSL